MYPTQDRSNIFDKMTIQLLERTSMWTEDVTKLSDNAIKRRLELLKVLERDLRTERDLRAERHLSRFTKKDKRLIKKVLVKTGLFPRRAKRGATIKQNTKKESPIHHPPSASTGPLSQAPQDWLS